VSLKKRLIEMIETNGPLPVSVYMQLCLHDPDDGYYANHPGLGTDFITAPEISQVFGELLGLWAAHEWQQLGKPDDLNLVELGPGRGTLMSDALRAIGQTGLYKASTRYFIEASPVLRAVQSEKLTSHAFTHVDQLSDVPVGQTLILANEYLDCLPARQFVRSEGKWNERVIGVDEAGKLAFGLAADRAPSHAANSADAAEIQPGLELLVDQLKRRAETGEHFRALFIDYGSNSGAPVDTLRAFKKGAQIHPLLSPGASDLTVDVDFQRLGKLAESAGLSATHAVTQGEFLMRLGIEQRMQALIKSVPERSEEIYDGVRRLVDPDEMGTRFNVMCISAPGLPPPAGF